ncbi:MAG TPA: CvpA family protein [Cytophagaceae bacterium]|nr:CvpA family protein [Cytophagaceae bacterium]
MVVVDFVIILLLGIGAYKGYKDGLVVTIIAFLAFIIGILAAFKLLDTGMKFLKGYISDNNWLPFIAFVVIFILVYITILLLSKFLKSALNSTLLGRFDEIAGGLLGIVKMAFGVSLLIWLIDVIHLNYLVNIFKGSFFYPYLVNFAPKIVSWISHVIPFQDIFQSLKQTLRSK